MVFIIKKSKLIKKIFTSLNMVKFNKKSKSFRNFFNDTIKWK
jgi:hypothetical protein